jgi:hypothetical protein
MMPAKNLVRMVLANTARSPRHFILSAFGIVIGIGAFVLFLALTQKAGAVLEKVFPVEEVKVVAPSVSLLGKDASKKLDDNIVNTILKRPEVKSAIPRLNLAFPALGVGSFEGADLRFEVGGFADGVDPGFVQDDDRIKELFKDWDSVPNDPNRVACVPPPPDPEGDTIHSPGVPPKDKPPVEGKYYNPCPTPDRYYCDDVERVCKHRVPIVLSATVVELYNNQFAKSHNMPMADKNLVNFLIQNRGLSAMRFSIGLGNTTVSGTGSVTRKPPRRIEAVIVGVSTRAMPIGVTVPIQYVKRWNAEYMGPDAANAYSSIIVRLKDRNAIAPFSQWLVDDMDLRLDDNLGERFATVIFVIRLLFLIISVAILVIAVINIGHNFFIQVSERRREIGIMRAVGATEGDVQLIVLGEAAVIGIVGGLLGIGLAVGIGMAWNAYAASGIPRFPFKPSSWFEFKPWIWGSALAFSTLFCILGGFLPARRAAKMEPAQALAQN